MLDASGSTDAEDGKPVSWQWDTDNDGVYDDLSGEIVQTSWDTPGTYYVDVKVTDSGGLSATLAKKLVIVVQNVENTPPVAVATADKYSAKVGEAITFDGTGSYDKEDGSVALYAWDFEGDHQYDDGFQGIMQHTYWAPSTYLVDLKVTDSGDSPTRSILHYRLK